MASQIHSPFQSQQPRGSTAPWWAGDALAIGFIVAAVLLVYWPIRKYPSISLDDPQYLFSNPKVLAGLSWHTFKWAFTSTTGGLWQPMTMLSLLLDVRLHGPNAGPMHVENVLLHAMSSSCWYVLLRGITSQRIPAFFTAALFALHPARVESVAWITERKDVLSMFMLVLSLIAWWRFTRRHRLLTYLISLVLFTLALMSKAMVVSQPVLMLLLDVWPLGRITWWGPTRGDKNAVPLKRLIFEKIPFLVLSALNSIIALRTQSTIGARPDLQILPLQQRLATAIVGYVRYLGEMFFPRHLAIYYPYQHDVPVTVVFVSGLLLVIITTALVRMRKSQPVLLVGWAWFVIAMVPVCGLFQAGDQSMADRFTYLPSVGLTFAVVWLAWQSVRGHGRRLANTAFGLGTVILGVLAVASRQYLYCWSNSIALFTQAASVNFETEPTIELHLADAYASAGRPDLAMDHYGLSMQLNPYNATLQINLANLLMLSDPALALEHYRTAIQLKPQNFNAHYDCGVCLKALNQDAEANVEFARAKQLKADE